MAKYLFLFLFILPGTGYLASGQSDTIPNYFLDEIVVTTQRIPQGQVYIPYGVDLITRKELNHSGQRSTPESLMSMNGIFIQKTNHGGGSPFIRGLTGNQTLLLLDGIRLNNSIFRYGPNQYLNTIDPYSLDKIEVAFGTGSVQYGSDALGGALQVFTREPVFSRDVSAWHGRVLGKYMTGNMEKTGRGELEYSSGKYAAVVGITGRDFGDLIGGKSTGKQTPSGYGEYACDGKFVFLPADKVRLTLAGNFLRQNHVPLYHKVVLENFALNEFDPQQRWLSYARMEVQSGRRIFNQARVIVSWQQMVEGRNSRKNGSSLLLKEKDRVNTLGLVVEINSEMNKAWSANSGVEIYSDHVNSERTDINSMPGAIPVRKRGLYPDNSGYGNYSMYSLHRIKLGKWGIDAGARFNSFMIHVRDTTLGEVRLSPEALVFNSAVMYSFNHKHHLYANFSNGYRAPNIDDMGTLGIVDFRYELPAYDLKPEKSWNFELGYKLGYADFYGRVTAYYNKLSQLITRVKVEGSVIDSYQVYKKENVNEACIYGSEASLSWKVVPDFEIKGGISYTYGQNVTQDEPLRRIPPVNGRIAGIYAYGKFDAASEFLFAGKQDRLSSGDKSDNRIQEGGTPGWQVLNLLVGYRLSSVKISAGLLNIFNRDYRTHGSGINGTGRSAWLAVDYSF